MKLTEKDRVFLDELRRLLDEQKLAIELNRGSPCYMVLRGTYGARVNEAFDMTRQGVRWRFQRLFNDIYVSAFETILYIEQSFGTELRDHAVRISKERFVLRQERRAFLGGPRSKQPDKPPESPESGGTPSDSP